MLVTGIVPALSLILRNRQIAKCWLQLFPLGDDTRGTWLDMAFDVRARGAYSRGRLRRYPVLLALYSSLTLSVNLLTGESWAVIVACCFSMVLVNVCSRVIGDLPTSLANLVSLRYDGFY